MKDYTRDGIPGWKIRLGMLVIYAVLLPYADDPFQHWWSLFMIVLLAFYLFRDWKNEKT
jgi:hypothetical protein